jgi:hypothetical protein
MEEVIIGRRSPMRIFVRMDVSGYQSEKKFEYVINELTRSHQTALFLKWDSGRMDHLFTELANSLHFLAVS